MPPPIGTRSETEPVVIADDGLFVVDPDTSRARQITDGAIYDAEWLSDGRIAYIRGSTLWLADADGGDKRQVHTGVTDGGFRDIAVSPDGRWIAFVAAAASSNPRPVWLMRSDGTGVRKIWNDTFNSSIGWAPDSKRLAFVSGGDEPLGMHVYDLDDDTATLLYGGFVDPLAWTPTGAEIVFFDGSVATINVVTKAYRPLVQTTAGRVLSIVLDPSGTRVFYADMNGLRVVPVTGGPSQKVGSDITTFDWTTSGDRAALVRETGEQDFDGRRITELDVAKPNFTSRRTIALAGTYATILAPSWSPNGERILVRSSLNKTPHPKP